MLDSDRFVLIPGVAGVIGRRLANGLSTINAPFYGLINSGKAKLDLNNDPIILPNGAYITPGDNVNTRINLARKNGQEIVGVIGEEFNWDNVSMILDCCTKGGTSHNLEHLYPQDIYTIVQGGTKVPLGFPHFSPIISKKSRDLYLNGTNDKRIKNISCNATALSMAIGDIALALGSPDRIKHVDANLFRRYKDPEDIKKLIIEPFTPNDKYGNDVGFGAPEFAGKIKSLASLNPWESHHYTTLRIEVEDDYDIEKVINQFTNNPRLAYLFKNPIGDMIHTSEHYDLDIIHSGLNRIVDAAKLEGIPHGDTAVNLVHAYQNKDKSIGIDLFVSQRWSSIPGTYDLMWSLTNIGEFKKANSFEEAQDRTNNLPLAYGLTFIETKRRLESRLN